MKLHEYVHYINTYLTYVWPFYSLRSLANVKDSSSLFKIVVLIKPKTRGNWVSNHKLFLVTLDACDRLD